jgi:glucoamylase
MSGLRYGSVQPAVAQADLTTVARYMFWLMFRNVASDGLVFEDPVNKAIVSQPGCVLASPSWENSAAHLGPRNCAACRRSPATASASPCPAGCPRR